MKILFSIHSVSEISIKEIEDGKTIVRNWKISVSNGEFLLSL